MNFINIFLLVVFVFSTSHAYKSYSGYQVLRTKLLNNDDLIALHPLYNINEYDFWSLPREGLPADIMTSPDHVTSLKDELTRLKLQPSVLVPDVAVIIKNDMLAMKKMKSGKKIEELGLDLDRFMSYDEIQAYLDEVVSSYPEIASLIELGSSYEGRVMKVLKLSSGEQGKSGMWIDAAIHAREWIAPPVALYTIQQLCLPQNRFMLDKNDFYILPVANPDGYSYTWTDDRFWRKTRSPNEGSSCIGTDPNRNFDIHWGENINDPCSNTYGGSAPFSEPEVKSISDFLIENINITFYTALHSQGQLILSPWSWTNDHPIYYDEMMRVGNLAKDALFNVRGTTFQVGSSADILYFSYGNSKDWAYGGLNITYSYTIELPAGGSGLFDPPPEDILPVVTETWELIKIFAENIPASRNFIK